MTLEDETLCDLWLEKQPALLPSARARLLGLLSVLQQAAPLLGQLHTVLFYLRGGQYHPAHRLAGISYLTLSPPGHQAAGTVRAFRWGTAGGL